MDRDGAPACEVEVKEPFVCYAREEGAWDLAEGRDEATLDELSLISARSDDTMVTYRCSENAQKD